MVAVRLGDLEGESARDLELGSAKSVSWGICQNAGWVTALFEMENRLRALLSAINQIDVGEVDARSNTARDSNRYRIASSCQQTDLCPRRNDRSHQRS